MKNWYAINAKADKPDEAEISIYDEIGYWGVTAAAFISDLKALGDVKSIVLSVNSPGGSVFDALAIYNALSNLRNKGVRIKARVMGIAASAASFVIMAANEIEMPENSFLMVHNALTWGAGDAEDLREMADILDKMDDSIVGIYVARTGKSEEDVRALLADDTYMSAKDAKEKGFVDTVTENVKATASFELDRLPENVKALFKSVQANTPAPAPEPAPVAQSPLAKRISEIAAGAGMQEFADVWALGCVDIEAAQRAVTEAGEIRALCEVAKVQDKAAGFIRNSTPLAKVREALIAARAEVDEKSHTSNVRQSTGSASTPQQGAFTTDEIYAARRKATR
jgi:ATP-dependent Clp endopeptidase proteolytic subunit ClpP